ncbi:MAG: hypothetical protein WCP10_03140, partial [Desulfuromonadales bacterium]
RTRLITNIKHKCQMIFSEALANVIPAGLWPEQQQHQLTSALLPDAYINTANFAVFTPTPVTSMNILRRYFSSFREVSVLK